MGVGASSNAHRCALAALERGDKGITAKELSEVTGIPMSSCCKAITHIIERDSTYRAKCVFRKKGPVKYRVIFVFEIFGESAPGGDGKAKPVIGTDASGNEYRFRSMRHASMEGYGHTTVGKRIKDGRPYAGLTWRLDEAAE